MRAFLRVCVCVCKPCYLFWVLAYVLQRYWAYMRACHANNATTFGSLRTRFRTIRGLICNPWASLFERLDARLDLQAPHFDASGPFWDPRRFYYLDPLGCHSEPLDLPLRASGPSGLPFRTCGLSLALRWSSQSPRRPCLRDTLRYPNADKSIRKVGLHTFCKSGTS